MKKTMLFASLLVLLFQTTHAELKPLENKELQAVEAQSAATINWSLSLNQTSPGVFANATGQYCNGTDVKFCRLAMSFNNRTTSDGKKQWLVLKGIQGTIGLNNVDIDGVDLLYSSDSNMTAVPDQIKAALQLSIKETSPILIRNFGFNAMSIETDTVANESSGNIPGYLAMGAGGSGVSAYANGVYTDTTNQFDQGRETGFTGMMMNGNLALQGTLKVFSCDASMKRC
ncbi:hypothetical protein F908_01112 [Acinetobacter sp. NIPH 284]|uniref:hypothetical protein n=1 Tax=Acinetobacter sp. NIPH 284 TaxID=1217704 RepID=UPI0002D074D2|nr:hypothetical protein [Acinetobacter sp. NIPH 284]ENW84202.1 hypothetical protein F908_01112 [Acinetobacter sp. NIPH 284]